MNKKLYRLIIIVLCALIMPFHIEAQTNMELGQLIEELKSGEWEVRARVSRALSKKTSFKAARDALVDEYIKMHKSRGSIVDTGEHGGELDYFQWLYQAVKELGDDRTFYIFEKHGMSDALVYYGEKGINIILKNVESYDNCSRSLLDLRELRKTLDSKSNVYVRDKKVKNKIKKIFIKSSAKFKHPEKGIKYFNGIAKSCGWARISVVKGLGYFAEEGDIEAIETIKKVAKNDPQAKERKGEKGVVKRYPVREEAQKVLDKLEKKGVIKKEENLGKGKKKSKKGSGRTPLSATYLAG